jgi:hypothetical protein
MYKIETGEIFAYDSAVHEFRPLLEVEAGEEADVPRYRNARAIA